MRVFEVLRNGMKRITLLLMAMLLCLLGLQGCASSASDKSATSQDKSANAASLTDNKKSNEGIEKGMTKIMLSSGNVRIEAELDNTSAAAREFIERLPLDLQMKEYGGREIYARIPKLPEEESRLSDYANGDVTYYPAGPSFAIFYAKADTSHQGGLIRMGKVISDLGLFEQLGDNPTVRIEVINGQNTQSVTDEEKEKQALRQFYDETWEAMVAKDMPKLDEQHAEQFVLVHMTGMQQPKKEFLKAIEKGDLNYYKSVRENVMITVNGDKAKIIGQNKVTAAVFGGSTNVWRLQLDFDAVKENGKWRMAHCKASTY